MKKNLFVELCLSVQAVRRDVEAIRTPLATALGVAASAYTHQLSNALRILSDVRVRHLLADEVGLGKTVQALMVLNALRKQRPGLQALVIVPDRLVPQWRDEMMTRAHTVPFGEDGESDGDPYIRLAWEDQLRRKDDQGNSEWSLADIDPNRFSVLIVDELHRLRADLQDRIVRVAANFEHVLVLTATPAFQKVERHAQLFSLLEPERTANARWRIATANQGTAEQLSVAEDISRWPEWASAAVVNQIIERDRDCANSVPKESLPETATALCAYRRVIRTRRADYSGVLPKRRHRPLVVEPLGAEIERQSLMWQYFGHLGELSTRFDPVFLAKRVILSPPSLEQRVDFLRRKGFDRGCILERVKPLVHRSQGDSRADALIDLLANIWSRDPLEPVLVAAQDNLTVDFLSGLVQARLPVIGPLQHRIPISLAKVRQGMMTEAVDSDLGGFGNETQENLEAFQRGNAQVLFAPEAGQVGLNLQCARILVLYSVPWRPEEVEQWIGRLDRIGNPAAFSVNNEAKSIDVYTIAQRGLVDEKVVSVLRHFNVFESGVNLDGEHLEEVAELIEAAVLGATSASSWAEIAKRAEVMAAEDSVTEFDSALKPHLPWCVHSAIAERQHLDSMPPQPPVLVDLSEHSSTGPRSWDRALEGFVKLLNQYGEYHIRRVTDPTDQTRFQTLWYKFTEPDGWGHREVLSDVVFTFGADPGHDRHPRNAHAFITRRGDIQAPPRRYVTMPLGDEEVRRPLRFLNFGDALHDELIEGWLPKNNPFFRLEVTFFDDHAIWESGKPGLYLVRVSSLDPAFALTEEGAEDCARDAIAHSVTQSEPGHLPELVRPFANAVRLAIEADIRWLRAQLMASVRLEVLRREDGQWFEVHAEEASALLNPMTQGRRDFPLCSTLQDSPQLQKAEREGLEHIRNGDSRAARLAWSHKLNQFTKALECRARILREEGRDAISSAGDELRYLEENLRRIQSQGNRSQISRAVRSRNAAADILSMTEELWKQREIWLRRCEKKVLSLHPREELWALLYVKHAV